MILADEYFQDSITNYGYTPRSWDYEQVDDLLTRVAAMEESYVEETGGSLFDLRSGHRTREKTLALIKAGYRASVGGKHETSQAVDIADPENKIDDWLTDAKLESFGLWREDPADTDTWCHVQNVPPPSGKRTFKP